MARILMVSSEASPFVKTGGLGDVMSALPGALARRGEEVGVVIPRYRIAEIFGAERIWHAMPVWVGPHHFTVAIDQVIREGVRYFFVDCPPLYDRAGIYSESGYDYGDNHLRFALLSRAAMELSRHIFHAGVFHCHDWPAGLLATYLRAPFSSDPTFFGAKCVQTIHNLGYQGNFDSGVLWDLGLDRSLYHPDGLEFYGRMSFLKAGIVWADAVTTVSPAYAREIQTPEYGFSMDGLLRSRASKLSGILNGVDYTEWDPSTDRFLPANYNRADLSGKQTCKDVLAGALGLPRYPDRPVIGIVSRFAYQKGMDFVGEIAAELAEENLALAVLGSGDAAVENMFRYFARLRPDKFGVHIGYDESLAHLIEAGSDMFLMPSRYEPSGLSQMYSLRYGTVPIVRATGGLDDTVDDTTGFKYHGYSPDALLDAIRRALQAFQDRQSWVERMRLGMEKDFSWDASARRYQELYRA
jgi:starch synthase